MPEHTPGYVAALAAALAQANTAAIYAAEHGDKQLGMPVTGHPGLRLWNGHFLRLGHIPLTPMCVEVNAIIPDSMGVYVDKAFHEHVHLTPCYPPPNYPRGDLDWRQWVHCAADEDGAIPITIALTRPTADPDDG